MNLVRLGLRGARLWYQEGSGVFFARLRHRLLRRNLLSVRRWSALYPYNVWIDQNEPKPRTLRRQRRRRFPYRPTISFLVPAYEPKSAHLEQLLGSLIQQTYPRWELCIAEGGSCQSLVSPILRRAAERDRRIRVFRSPANRGITGNTQAAAAVARGDYVAFLDQDDLLAPFAAFQIIRTLNRYPDADVLYSDEDRVDAAGVVRSDPHFKPDWAPDTLHSTNYLARLLVLRRDLFDRLGGLDSAYDASPSYDLALRATEQATRVVHVPKVLYHRRLHPQAFTASTRGQQLASDAGWRALQACFERNRLGAQVDPAQLSGIYRVTYTLPRRPLVTIIIPNRDEPELLERCIRSIQRSSYSNYEILIVENRSELAETCDLYEKLKREPGVRLHTWEKPFNYSAVNNHAVSLAQGEMALFLNNDIEVITSDWMERLLEYALRDDVGAIGAKLYYPDDTIQHGGVIVGLGGVAGHSHPHFPRSAEGYQGRLKHTQNLSAVTGACLMMRKSLFQDIGGFDEQLAIAFNDVDLCLRIRKRGFLIVWTPYAELYHWESKTRGVDDTPAKKARFDREVQLFTSRWRQVIRDGDPYYNPNLSYGAEDFSLKYH